MLLSTEQRSQYLSTSLNYQFMMLFAICSYCKGYGHYKSHCLKLITKSPNTDICRDYNRFKKSQCQTETEHFCLSGREHRCSICSKSDCKAYLHIHDNYQHWPNTEMESQHTQLRRLIKTLEAEILTLQEKCVGQIHDCFYFNTIFC